MSETAISRSEAIEVIACGLFNHDQHEFNEPEDILRWLDVDDETRARYRKAAAGALDNILTIMKRNREARTALTK